MANAPNSREERPSGGMKLPLDQHATPAIAGFYLNNNVIEKASIVMYGQQ